MLLFVRMKAWQVHAFSEPEQMTLDEIPVPDPGPHEVRIRNHAAALNFFDILQIQGKYQVRPPFPFVPGAEVAGTVDAVGTEVKHVFPGDPVMAMTHNGAFAEYSLAAASRTFHLIAGMEFAEAAAMPVVYHTSYFALHRRAGLAHREWLLVHAGASGVGMSAIQIGKAYGAQVIATAGSPAKLDFCRKQGADHVLSYADPAWVERVKEITEGRGVDVVYDPVGGDVFDLSTRCIAAEGRMLVIGFASGLIPSVQTNRVLLKDISIVGVHWGQYVAQHPEFLSHTHEVLTAMYLGGQIHPVVGRSYRLEEVPSGLRELAGRKLLGKAVVHIAA
ncbi:MAG TPA: NADPH:quinone oxidoreductase family protein [Bryobacteraceae bacterium]|nr:NADPH:quinone oxidoreductase family protein [Bryobacteraceae bacterium]